MVNESILSEPAHDSKKENFSPLIFDLRGKKNLDNKLILSSSDLSREDGDLSQEGRDLNAFYEKEAIRDKKNIAKYLHILAK